MPTKTEIDRMARDETVRLLGARDGYIGAMLKVRQQIANLTHGVAIDPRHVRKLKERERLLSPLRTLERMFDEQQKACSEAYKERTRATV